MPLTHNDRVASEVRAEMARQRKSQRWVAEQMGVSQVYLSRRLSGRVDLGITDVERIAAVLAIPFDRLMQNGEPTPATA